MTRDFKTRLSRYLMVLVAVLALGGCMVLGGNPQQQIQGRWQSTIGGFPVTVTYTDTTVQVAGEDPVPYSLDGDRLSFKDGDSQVRILSFPSKTEMVQRDPMTGTETRYTRAAL